MGNLPNKNNNIDVANYLRTKGVDFRVSGDKTQASAKCFFHNSKDYTLSINLERGFFHCFYCGKSGAFIGLQEALGDPIEKVTIIPQKTNWNLSEVTFKILDLWHYDMPEDIQKYLQEKRGLTVESIENYHLGWNGYAIAIPNVKNRKIVGVKFRRNPNEDKEPRFWQAKGSRVDIFNSRILENKDKSKIFITEAELDAILMTQLGYPTVCFTGGCGTFYHSWAKHFAGFHEVFLVMDTDVSGKRATERVASILTETNHAAKIITFPHQEGEKVDPAIYFIGQKHTEQEFDELINQAIVYTPPQDEPQQPTLKTPTKKNGTFDLTNLIHKFNKNSEGKSDTQDIIKLNHLLDTDEAQYDNKRVEVDLLITGIGETYHLPLRVKLNRSPSYIEWIEKHDGKSHCLFCSEFDSYENIELSLKAEPGLLIELTRISKDKLESVIQHSIPCGFIEIDRVIQMIELQELLVAPLAQKIRPLTKNDKDILIDEKGREYKEKIIYYTGITPQSNVHCHVTGWVIPHPKNQTSTMLVDSIQRINADFENFTISNELKKDFSVFQAQEDQSVKDKVWEILNDVSDNVTNIYGEHRMRMLCLNLLCLHSIKTFSFDSEVLRRGVLDVCELGDTGQGKTQTIERLLEAIGLGQSISGTSARRTGISYSFHQFGATKTWFLKWGAYPLNDGRLLFIDEAEKLYKQDIQNIATGRSEGIIKATGVKTGEHNSRTRLIMAVNPKENRNIHPQLITPEILRSSVCWAWTRKPEDVEFSNEAIDEVYNVSRQMRDTYGHARDIPLLSADTRHKIARLAVAAASLLHSTDETHYKVMVTSEHVNFVENFLNEIYQHKNCSFDLYAKQCREAGVLKNEEYQQFLQDLQVLEEKENDNGVLPEFKSEKDVDIKQSRLIDICKHFISNERTRAIELASSLGITTQYLSTLLQPFRKHRMLWSKQGSSGGYQATPKFIKVLKRMIEEGIIEL
jgi:hypothetical protein